MSVNNSISLSVQRSTNLHSQLVWGLTYGLISSEKEFVAFLAAYAIHNPLNFVPPGIHYCWMNRSVKE